MAIGVNRRYLVIGEHARLGRWFQRLAETILRSRDGFAHGRDARAPQTNPRYLRNLSAVLSAVGSAKEEASA
jgi:hypothetical protein